MDRGSYVAASGGLAEFKRLEIVANNLANVNTVGYKQQLLVSEQQNFDQTLASIVAKNDPLAKADQQRTPAVVNFKTETDFSQGSIKITGNPLDVALLNPKDFFEVTTPEGLQYTRAGNLSLNSQGQLTTIDGFPVNGEGGPINASGGKVTINDSGDVVVNETKVGKIKAVRFEDPSLLERAGFTRFKVTNPQSAPQAVEASLSSGALEMANISAISSMIELINTNKAFALYTKSAATMDSLNQASINAAKS